MLEHGKEDNKNTLEHGKEDNKNTLEHGKEDKTLFEVHLRKQEVPRLRLVTEQDEEGNCFLRVVSDWENEKVLEDDKIVKINGKAVDEKDYWDQMDEKSVAAFHVLRD